MLVYLSGTLLSCRDYWQCRKLLEGERLPMAPLRKTKPSLIPDPGQRVRLRAGRGRWRGRYRAVSYPYTDASGMVVVQVAEEREYRDALREGRRALRVAWPVKQMEVLLPPEGSEEGTQELPINQSA